MLSFNCLGNLGRLANQMFQYAAVKGIATHRGYEFCIPPRAVFGTRDSATLRDLNLYDLFRLDERNHVCETAYRRVEERGHTFDAELFDQCPDNVDLFGYFQTERYFKHIEEAIRSDFAFAADLFSRCSEWAQSFRSELIALHVRRGDYVGNPNHPLLTTEYYRRALEQAPPGLPVLVFSDDCAWCSAQELFRDPQFVICDSGAVDWDLCMMSLCSYHVIANSSLSWWGAWLANSQQVIAPRHWFHGGCSDKDVRDMAFGNWLWLA